MRFPSMACRWGMRADDPVSWYHPDHSNGHVKKYQSQGQWDIRQAPRLHGASGHTMPCTPHLQSALRPQAQDHRHSAVQAQGRERDRRQQAW